jgi:hypothetical protein
VDVTFGVLLTVYTGAYLVAMSAGGVIVGFLGGVVDLLMNADGARIERRLGCMAPCRPVRLLGRPLAV